MLSGSGFMALVVASYAIFSFRFLVIADLFLHGMKNLVSNVGNRLVKCGIRKKLGSEIGIWLTIV